jgi:hypothetical protein
MAVEGVIFMVDLFAGQLGLHPFGNWMIVLQVVDVNLTFAVNVECGLTAGFALLCASVVGDALLFDAAFVELKSEVCGRV